MDLEPTIGGAGVPAAWPWETLVESIKQELPGKRRERLAMAERFEEMVQQNVARMDASFDSWIDSRRR